MKKIFLSSVIILVMALIGCQDNSVTNPVSPDLVNKVPNGTHDKTIKGTITLDRMLVLHNLVNTYFQLKGDIHYTEQLTHTENSISPLSLEFGNKVNIDINALLFEEETVGGNSQNWDISSSSENVFVYNQTDESHILIKKYLVRGRTDGLTLVVQYIVKKSGVELGTVSLELQN